MMKQVAQYNGKVLKLNTPPQASSVRLEEVGTKNILEAVGVVTETLLSAGLIEGDEFEIIINESIDGQHSGVIRKKQPLSDEFSI
jgi:hypothetical protein